MTVIVRFAPSPTGYLHVGNLRTALINWLYARKAGGQFILRFDDTDTERSKEEYERQIEQDLQWLQLGWDRRFRQRDRYDLYEAAKQKLIEAGRLYPCYETAEEIEIKRKMQVSRGKPPIYDRAALQLTDEQKKELQAEGRKPHYRFKLSSKAVEWNDLIRGKQSIKTTHISDPVLIRGDGVPLYTLSSTVDDGETGTTHILRGEDHVTNTAVQLQVFEALGYEPPQFGHNALLQMAEGKLSKRTGGGEIKNLREKGYEAMAVNSLLARLGTSDPVEVFNDMEALISQFDIKKFGRAAANYDEGELERLNEKLLSRLPYSAISSRLEEMCLGEITEAFWLAVRENLSRLEDIRDWWEMVHQPITPVIEDEKFTHDAAALLPDEALSEAAYHEWIDRVKVATGRKGKNLFMPIRLALTGRPDGPELPKLFSLLDTETISLRLQGQRA